MFNFIKEAIRELEHVVWPTPKETRKYMNYNIGVIIVVTVILSILGLILTTTLTELRKITYHGTAITSTNSDIATQEDLENLLNSFSGNIQVSGEATNVEVSPITTDQSGATLPTLENITSTGSQQ